MESNVFETYTNQLRASLESRRDVLGLVTLGSTADSALRDEWSDHDFWVITTPGTQDEFVNDLSWLPDYHDIAIVVCHGKHNRTVLYRNRHQAEFAVFDLNEARMGKIERYQVLIDRGGIAELIESVHQNTVQEVHVKPDALENLCATVWSACERSSRGELLSARQYIDGFAVNKLLGLISSYGPDDKRKDTLDPRRRLELRSPALAAEMMSLRDLPVPEAALRILEIAEQKLKSTAPNLAWDKVEMVQSWIRDSRIE
jgi:lincosamide nucleotidyltransferase B/F